MSDQMHRRDILKTAALGAAAMALASQGKARASDLPRSTGSQTSQSGKTNPLALRVAHLTDVHIQPERRAAEGFASALTHVQANAKPDLILTGGDHIMDSFAHDEARTKLQWDLYTRVYKENCSVPVRHAIGNHDVWGWNKGKSKTTGSEPMWGKKWATDQLGLSRSYHSFDQAGWHFVCLDSVAVDPKDPNGYIGRLGEEQTEWLRNDLAGVAKDTPVLVLSHIPILSVTAILGHPSKDLNGYSYSYNFSGGGMHTDSWEIREIFAQHPNVKLCLSGHTHRLDRVDFRGVSYICNGAVSGNWWKGVHFECQEGYAVLDLYKDGSFENRYIPYGWEASEA